MNPNSAHGPPGEVPDVKEVMASTAANAVVPVAPTSAFPNVMNNICEEPTPTPLAKQEEDFQPSTFGAGAKQPVSSSHICRDDFSNTAHFGEELAKLKKNGFIHSLSNNVAGKLNNIQSLVFIFEESSFLHQCGLPLSIDRWKTIHALHIVFPSNHQICHAKSGDDHHHQTTVSELLKAMKKATSNFKAFFHFDKAKQTVSNFMTVTNGNDARKVLTTMDLEKCTFDATD